MPSQIWEATDEYKQLVNDLKNAYHEHLALASIWVLITDQKHIVDNRLVITDTKRCTKTEKLKTGHDFKITIRAESWPVLTEAQRKIAIDEALCRCGVRFMPETMNINNKDIPIRDDIGRVIYTTTIATDDQGNPKWKMNQLDAGAYFGLLQRYNVYSEEVGNILNVLSGKPIKKPIAAVQQQDGDDITEPDTSGPDAPEPDGAGDAQPEDLQPEDIQLVETDIPA